MKKPYDIETIEQYLTNQLGGEELQAFEEALASDEELAAAVAEHYDAMLGIEYFGEQELRSDINRTEGELDDEGFFLVAADLDNYLDGKTDDATRAKIERRRQADTDFSQQLDLHDDTRQSIELLGEEFLRDSIKEVESELESEGFFDQKAEQTERPVRTLGRRVTLRRALAVAASIAVLVIAYFVFFQPDTSPQGLYASYYEKYESDLGNELELKLSETGFGTTDDMIVQLNLLLDGVQAYEAGNYEQAVQLFEGYRTSDIVTEDELYQQATLYQALAHQELEQSDAAINLLQSLTNNTTFEQQLDAKWYLALAYLQADQVENARPILQELETTSTYDAQAGALLQKLSD